MNLVYDPKVKEMLCPRCWGIAEFNDNGDLECKECGYIYYMHSDRDNTFQIELNFKGD